MPKIPIWVILGRPRNGKCGGTFYDHLENLMAIWYNLWFRIVCGKLDYFPVASHSIQRVEDEEIEIKIF
jgi:hypothetical protein